MQHLVGVSFGVVRRLVEFVGEGALPGGVESELKHDRSVLVRLDETLGMADGRHAELEERVFEIGHLAEFFFADGPRQQLHTTTTTSTAR